MKTLKKRNALFCIMIGLAVSLNMAYVSPASAASLEVIPVDPPNTVNLTTEGTTDWVSWTTGELSNGDTRTDASPYARKNDGAGISIDYYNILDTGGLAPLNILATGDPHAKFEWDDGATPITAGSENHGCLQMGTPASGGEGTSFTFEVAATTTGLSRLTLYLGCNGSQASLTITLPGVDDYIFEIENSGFQSWLAFTIDYQANNAEDILTATWKDTGSNSQYSNIQIVAATLAGVPEFEPSESAPRILKLEAIAALEDILKGDEKTDKRLEDAIEHLCESVAPDLWEGDSHLTDKGKDVFKDERKAVKKLEDEIKDKKSVFYALYLQVVIDTLVEADRLLAETAIKDAEDAGGDAKYIAYAYKEMGKAEAYEDKEDFDKAIEHYGKAWEKAEKAREKAEKDSDSDKDDEDEYEDDD